MFKKKDFVTVVFSRKIEDVTTAGTIMMIVTGDKDAGYYDDFRFGGQMFIKTHCRRFRYWLAKRFLKVYAPNLCGFNCPEV